MSPQRYESGLRGEELAMAYLRGQGMREVCQRYRAAGGEIDLIAEDGTTLVFVEVKYRPSGHRGDGLAAVTPAKRRRLVRAARVYLVSEDRSDRPVRFDVVEITRDGVLHIPNAFGAS